MRKKWIFLAPLALLGVAFFIAIGGEVVKLLWNWLLPALFGWRQIGFWQAVGLLALCRILFGGLRGHGGPGSSMGRRMRERMEQRMAERCEQMTPEERERFRQRMRERWGFGPSTGESKGQ
ncbi:MAG TPA: hypothetical protein VGS20_14040 [Candidatus Acidoferrales bacterium]|nr:hypothetical protein [Candidatus Acidoferrales bacterium]